MSDFSSKERLSLFGGDADTTVVGQPRFRQVTWEGEQDQHFIPAAAEIVPGFAVLCGKRGPDIIGEPNEVEGQIEKPLCRRCTRAWGKINGRWFRRDRQELIESVERDLGSLPVH